LSIAFLLVLFFALFFFVQGLIRYRKISREISNIREGAAVLEADNARLSDFLEYSDDGAFKEKEARLKLEMQKEGEQIIVISPSENDSAALIGEDESSAAATREKGADFGKWWDYFFKR